MERNQKTDYKIGIGVTTTPNRPEYIDTWRKNFEKVKPKHYHLHIHEDVSYKGVAYSKNQNLKTLQDCDYIFLFDDDCYPIKEGWAEYFINSNEHHLLFLNHTHKVLARTGNVEHYNDCGGVFMFITSEVLSKVGYINSAYGRYGFEHAGYSNRIYKAGLTRSPYQQLVNTKEYLYAMDYSIKHRSSLTDEEKINEIKKNSKIFVNELNDKNYFIKFEE
jgi:hypothetical protein